MNAGHNVPMIAHGDESGRTQQGNNNVYSHDSELSWLHWDDADRPMTEFTAALSRLRREHPTFRRARFFDGRPVHHGPGEPLPDIVWPRPDGTVMEPEDWDVGVAHSLGLFLNGDGIQGHDSKGRRIVDVNFVVYFNGNEDLVEFTVPPQEYANAWNVVVDTAGQRADATLAAGESLLLEARSLLVLQARSSDPEAEPDNSVSATLVAAGPGAVPE